MHVPGTTWLGIAVAVGGAVLATGADVTVSGHAVAGDLLALAGGVAAAVYATYGERARATLSTTAYTTICYAVCAAGLALACLLGRVPLAGWPATTWLAIAAMTAGPQLLGHSLLNYALHRLSATTISVIVLFEVPGAALIGWAWLRQVPPARTVPGLVVLVLGVLVVVIGAARRRQPTSPEARSVEQHALGRRTAAALALAERSGRDLPPRALRHAAAHAVGLRALLLRATSGVARRGVVPGRVRS